MSCSGRRVLSALWPLVGRSHDKAVGFAAAVTALQHYPRSSTGRILFHTVSRDVQEFGTREHHRSQSSSWCCYTAAQGNFRSFSSREGDSSSSDDSDSSDSDVGDLADLGSDSDDDDDEGQWTQYRELKEGQKDDDADDTDPLIPEDRYQLSAESRNAARGAIEADEEDKDEDFDSESESGPASVRAAGPDGDMPLKQLYDLKLDQYSEEMGKFMEDLGKKKMTMKEKLAAMNEHGAKESMQLHGMPHIPSEVIEPGIAQLEALTSEHEWHMTIVDVKMTTKQTPQGKKSRFSSMVMVGNLQGKGGYGIGAAKEVNDSIFKAMRLAILGSINIPMYRRHTVYYPSRSKFIRTKISIFPRPSDFGINASPIITEACELLGIRDITVKTHNSRNIRNVVKGFFQALAHIPTAAEVAQAKGVYMREKLAHKLYTKEFF